MNESKPTDYDGNDLFGMRTPKMRRMDDPKLDHYYGEAWGSACDASKSQPVALTDEEKAQDRARMAAQAETERVEGRVRFPRPDHDQRRLNPHD